MKFKTIQQEDIERVQHEEKAKQQAAAASSKAKKTVKEEQPVPETVIPPVAEKSAKVSEPKSKPTENKFSSPNIDDILNAAEYHSASKSGGKSRSGIASSGSIDDLIAVLENEKKKL